MKQFKAESFTRRVRIVIPKAGKFRWQMPPNGMRLHKVECFDEAGIPVPDIGWVQDGLELQLNIPEGRQFPGIVYVWLVN